MRKGQAAIELLMILAFAFLLLTPFIWQAVQTSQVETNLIQARKVVNDLASAAEYVYAQGTGSVARVRAKIPPGVIWNESYIGKPSWANQSIEPREIQLRVEAGAGYNDVWKSVRPNLRGSWPNKAGTYLFTVYLASDGYVVITPYLSIMLDPQSQYLNIPAGNSSTFQFTVSNYLDHNVNVTINKTGEVAGWVSLSNTSAVISSQGQEVFNATVSVPAAASAGLHYATITVSGENTTEYLDITINVYNAQQANVTKPQYLVELYEDAGYSVTQDTFYQGANVHITTGGWNASEIITLDILNPSNNSVSGFPKTVQAEVDGTLTYQWDPVGATPGVYTVRANNTESTVTTTFEVTSCAGQ